MILSFSETQRSWDEEVLPEYEWQCEMKECEQDWLVIVATHNDEGDSATIEGFVVGKSVDDGTVTFHSKTFLLKTTKKDKRDVFRLTISSEVCSLSKTTSCNPTDKEISLYV